MDQTDKYIRLVRELVTPKDWSGFRDLDWLEVRPEHREKVIQAGVNRFDELFSAGYAMKASTIGARAALRKKVHSLEKAHQRALDRLAPTIRAKIDELTQGKDDMDGWKLGYEVAAALKALGYKWEQVRNAMVHTKLHRALSTPIEVAYTGIYD